MMVSLKKVVLAASLVAATLVPCWGQSLTPLGTFEAGTLDGFNSGGAQFEQSNLNSDADLFTISAVTPLAGARSASLDSTTGNAFGDRLYTSVYPQTTGQFFFVSFLVQSSRAAVGGLTIELANGIFEYAPFAGANSQAFDLTGGLQTIRFAYSATTTGANQGRFDFLINGSNLGTIVGDRLQIDNVAVTVPELNAMACGVPLMLVSSLLLLAYDRRRSIGSGSLTGA